MVSDCNCVALWGILALNRALWHYGIVRSRLLAFAVDPIAIVAGTIEPMEMAVLWQRLRLAAPLEFHRTIPKKVLRRTAVLWVLLVEIEAPVLGVVHEDLPVSEGDKNHSLWVSLGAVGFVANVKVAFLFLLVAIGYPDAAVSERQIYAAATQILNSPRLVRRVHGR